MNQSLADAARAMHVGSRTADVLLEICRAAVRAIGPCEQAAISVPGRDGASTAAASHDGVREVLRIQRVHHAGPSTEALLLRQPIVVRDIADTPAWADLALSGLRSLLALPLWVEEEGDLGVLTLCAAEPGAFDDAAVVRAEAFATHAALAFAHANAHARLDNLSVALQTNRHIGMAIGIVMARTGLDEEKAFEALRAASQEANRKVREIAEDVVLTGSLPEPSRRVGPRAGA